jgi:hypothetical protein
MTARRSATTSSSAILCSAACTASCTATPIGRRHAASLRALADETGDFPRLRAARPHLQSATADQIFDAELDMLILAIQSTVNPEITAGRPLR